MIPEEIEDGFIEFAKEDLEGALILITGLFIGLNVGFVELMEGKAQSEKEINIEGPKGQRRITIHATERGL